MAEDDLFAAVVLEGFELDAAEVELAALRFLHGPAGEAARDFHHVLLRVAAVDAEGVQLQQLARVVFVGLVGVVGLLVHAAVEIPEHRGAERGGAEHGGELAERVGADDIAVVGDLEPLGVALGGVNVEVVAPEVDHHLVELALGEDGAQHGAADEGVE